MLVAGIRCVTLFLAIAGNSSERGDLPRSIVKGRCVDVDGAPIAEARVFMSSVGEPWRTDGTSTVVPGDSSDDHVRQQTGADGRFEFDVPLPTSSWITLVISPDPYHMIAGRDFGRGGGRNKDPLREGVNDLGDFILATTGAISGRVVDTAGNPLAGVDVSLDGSFADGHTRQARTIADGTYLLGHVPQGDYECSAKAIGFTSARRARVPVTTRTTTNSIDFTLTSAAMIGGVVVDSDGMPLAGVELWGWPVSSGTGAGARTNSKGEFKIALPQNEPYTLEATLEGYDRYDEGHGSNGHAPGDLSIRIELRSLARATFRVVDNATGEPVTTFGLRIIETPWDANGSSSAFEEQVPQLVHENGSTTEFGDPAKHDFQIEAVGYASQQGQVKFDASGGRTQTIHMIRGGVIHGRVLFGSEALPIDGAIVHVEGTAIHYSPWTRTTDVLKLSPFLGRRRTGTTKADGAFELLDLPTGRFDLEIHAPSAARYRRAGIELGAMTSFDLGDISLEPEGVVDGEVVGNDGARLGGITVFLDEPFKQVTATTDNAGRFHFGNLETGKHSVLVASDWIEASRTEGTTVDVKAGETTKVLLAPPGKTDAAGAQKKRAIHVVAKVNGNPAAGMIVTQVEKYGGIALATTDHAGLADFEIPASESIVVGLESEDGLRLATSEALKFATDGSTEVAFDVAAGNLIVTLPEGTSIPADGSVVIGLSPKGWNAESAPYLQGVEFSKRGDSKRLPFEPPGKLIEKDTVYALGLLPQGAYTVVVSGSVLRYRKKVVIEAGKTSECTMTLDDAD